MQKFSESEYQKEYDEIMAVYGEQIKPYKNPVLIAFIVITAIIGTVVFVYVFFNRGHNTRYFFNRLLWNLDDFDYRIGEGIASVFYFIPGTYAIGLRKIIRHKDRRLKDLEAKKTEAVSMGFYDANS